MVRSVNPRAMQEDRGPEGSLPATAGMLPPRKRPPGASGGCEGRRAGAGETLGFFSVPDLLSERACRLLRILLGNRRRLVNSVHQR